jgi:hypothetical protein
MAAERAASGPAAGRPEGPSIEWGIRGAVLAVVAVLCALLIAAQASGGESSHSIDITLHTALLDQGRLNVMTVGSASGTLGPGSVTVDHIFRLPATGRPFAPGVPMRFSGKVFLRNGKGSVVATLVATTTTQADGGNTTTGTGTVIDGTGEYDDASGSFRLRGSQAATAQTNTLRLVGTLKY